MNAGNYWTLVSLTPGWYTCTFTRTSLRNLKSIHSLPLTSLNLACDQNLCTIFVSSSHVTLHNNNNQSGGQQPLKPASQRNEQQNRMIELPHPFLSPGSGRPALPLAGHSTAPASAAASKPGAGARSHGGRGWPPSSLLPAPALPPLPAPPYWFTSTPHAPATLVTHYSNQDPLPQEPI